MKGLNTIFFSFAVIFYSLSVLDVLVTAAPVDGDPNPTPDTFPDPPFDAGPDPVPVAELDPVPDEGEIEADLEPEPESESDESDESKSESDSDSEESEEADPYENLSWMEEWQRRIVTLNQVVYRLQTENLKLQRDVYAYEKELHIVQELEASLSNEVETWFNGMQFPGLAPVHDPIGIPSDKIINSVGEEVSDCNDALGKGNKKPGVYLLNPNAPYNVRALCVNGWTVIQRRFDGTENFNRDFDDYVAGFGNFSGEFFLGLENLHLLTKEKAYTLRVDVKAASGKWYYAVYEDFSLSDEQDQYRLLVGNMTDGNYFDGLENGRNQQFSSSDRDNDEWVNGNCAHHFGGGWWSSTCNTNLNQGWCRSGCLQWASKRVVSSIMRIKPTDAVVPEDVSENPNPGGLTLAETPA